MEQDGVWSIDDEKAIPMLQKRRMNWALIILTPRRIVPNSNSEITVGKCFEARSG